MNEILKKATEELAEDKPDIAYVRGMLDTLLAMNGGMNISDTTKPFIPPVALPVPLDEAALLDAKARAAIDYVKSLPTDDQLAA